MRNLRFLCISALLAACETINCPAGTELKDKACVPMNDATVRDMGVDAPDTSVVDTRVPDRCGDQCVNNQATPICYVAGGDAGTDGAAADGATGQCVQCRDDVHCDGVSGKPVCDLEDSECVQCNSNNDCGGSTPECSANVCVRCDASNSPQVCGAAKTCDIAEGKCVDVGRGTVSDCGPCKSTEQCVTGRACVAANFNSGSDPQDTEYGFFCLPTRLSEQADCTMRPYVFPGNTASVEQRVGLVGSTLHCALRPVATCTLLADMASGRTCTGTVANTANGACGEENLADGVCSAGKCSFACGGDSSRCPLPANVWSCPSGSNTYCL